MEIKNNSNWVKEEKEIVILGGGRGGNKACGKEQVETGRDSHSHLT